MVVQLFPYSLADGLAANYVGDRNDEEEFYGSCDAHLRQQNVQMRVQAALQNFADPVRLFRAHIIRKPTALGANFRYHECDRTLRASVLAERRGNQGRQRKDREGNRKDGAVSQCASCPDMSYLRRTQYH